MEFTLQPVPETVDVYDYIEWVLTDEPADPDINPFYEFMLWGEFTDPDGNVTHVSGFCDAQEGGVFRLRFMPRTAGVYRYRLGFRLLEYVLGKEHTGEFTAHDAGRKGMVAVDPAQPFHFQWSGTGEHFHYNGTTSYSLLALSEPLMERAIDRLHGLGVNRLRVTLSLRVPSGREWNENVDPTDDFTFRLNPWQAARPNDVADPGWDTTRYNVAFWQKTERMLRRCRERDMSVSVIFYTDGRRPGIDPFKDDPAGDAEKAYYRYAVHRLAAFSNVTWDVTNEYRLFRDDQWARTMGAYLRAIDPYGHLISVHGHGDFRFRTEEWADFAMFQSWDEHGGNAYMLKNRQEQAEIGRIIPQVNEEYGYEDHYPTGWGEGRVAPSRNADSRRRLAWEIAMAGCYQTTGERPLSFTQPDQARSPVAGWLNGLGADDSTEMLDGNRRIVEFFKPLDSRTFTPANERVRCDKPAFCLARDGAVVVYVSDARAPVSVEADAGHWSAQWFDPTTGEYEPEISITHPGGILSLAPHSTATGDAALLLTQETNR